MLCSRHILLQIKLGIKIGVTGATRCPRHAAAIFVICRFLRSIRSRIALTFITAATTEPSCRYQHHKLRKRTLGSLTFAAKMV
jgi:hypothetical protein